MQRGSSGLLSLVACSLPEFDDGEFADLSWEAPPGSALQSNLASAKIVVNRIFEELESGCLEEKEQYERSGQTPPAYKRNRWDLYLTDTRLRECVSLSLEFLRSYPDCRDRMLTEQHLRFLVLLQHFIAEDTSDFYRPKVERQHSDAFEGFLTSNAVNAQLIKDAHRSEWSIEGCPFLLKEAEGHETLEERKQTIASFQRELVTALESFLLGFCRRRCLPELATQRFLQVVTTQMSQCGLANLDRSSTAGKYFVSGQGLEQRITYNLSSMDVDTPKEALKLSLLCMKTGFSLYHHAAALSMHEHDGEEERGPSTCLPSSYLYQYATLRFSPVSSDGRVTCCVIDALDEVHIEAAPSPC